MRESPPTMQSPRPGGLAAGQRGVALIDVLMALVLFSLAAGGIFAANKASIAALKTARQFVGEQQAARLILDYATRRLRMVGNYYFDETGPLADPPIAWADISDITFCVNTDPEAGPNPTTIERHRIYLDSGVVYVAEDKLAAGAPCERSFVSGQPISTVVEFSALSVPMLSLNYYSGAGAGTVLARPVVAAADRAAIRRIVVEIEVQGRPPAAPFRLWTEAFVR